jgi:hypothetical protein
MNKEKFAKKPPRCGDFAKYMGLLLIVMILTISGSLFVHRSDMNELHE